MNDIKQLRLDVIQAMELETDTNKYRLLNRVLALLNSLIEESTAKVNPHKINTNNR